MTGKLFAISTGPGCSDLLTIRAVNCLSALTILYAPAGRQGGTSLALSIVQPYLPDHIEIKLRHFPMTTNSLQKEHQWDAIAHEMAKDVDHDHLVGFISLGDSMLFSTWVNLLARLQNKIPIAIIPGITSFAYIASRCQIPLAMEQQSMAVISCTAPANEIESALVQHQSLILMKVTANFPLIKHLLIKHHLINHAVLVCNAALETEYIYHNIQTIDEQEKLSYFTTILINKLWQ